MKQIPNTVSRWLQIEVSIFTLIARTYWHIIDICSVIILSYKSWSYRKVRAIALFTLVYKNLCPAMVHIQIIPEDSLSKNMSHPANMCERLYSSSPALTLGIWRSQHIAFIDSHSPSCNICRTFAPHPPSVRSSLTDTSNLSSGLMHSLNAEDRSINNYFSLSPSPFLSQEMLTLPLSPCQ